MEKPNKLPFAKEEVFRELKITILTEASQIALMKGDAAANTIAGFVVENWSSDRLSDLEHKVDLTEFSISRVVDISFDYAFQIGRYADFTEDHEFDLTYFLESLGRIGYDGNYTPIMQPDSKLRLICDMAIARSTLDRLSYHEGLTLRQLAALSGMTEAAVRTSISSEGFKTVNRGKGQPVYLSIEDAEEWLKKRRGFIPSIKRDTLLPRSQHAPDFDIAIISYQGMIMDALKKRNQDLSQFVAAAGKDREDNFRRVTELDIGLDEIEIGLEVADELGIDRRIFVSQLAAALVSKRE